MSLTGKVYCGGNCYVDTKVICTRCAGNTELTYPLSSHARITSQKSYFIYQLKIVTLPADGKAEVYDYSRNEYKEVNPNKVNWWNQSDKEYTMDMQRFAPGMYYMSIKNRSFNKTFKIIVK
ncbi:MAG: hypothetical protein IT243_07625 [Bacteroidia bacterium]|nr:hypothetical protein [Bacteroidia bacterium]